MKIEYKHRVAFGLVLLLLGIAIEIIWKGVFSLIASLFTLFGLILIIGSALRHLKFGEGPERDERTTKLGAFALAYSWLVTFIFVSLLLWLDIYNLVKMSAYQALSLTLAVATVAAGVFQWFFRRKGDVA
ncbi:MAG: hypothetical protein LUQ20_09345 [Candidatus Methanoperedens sp.]|nr:hypothetical protein [Candidatus Methanoperedens sp.]